jgi:uncharacterized protein YciI
MNADGVPETLEVESLYAIEAEFALDGRERRRAVRRTHLENYERLVREGTVLFGGALGDVESAFIVVRAPDEVSVRELAERDVYWTSGAWSSYRVRPYALVRLRAQPRG